MATEMTKNGQFYLLNDRRKWEAKVIGEADWIVWQGRGVDGERILEKEREKGLLCSFPGFQMN